MCKEKIAIKGMLDYSATATLLDELATSYRDKTVCIERGEEVICLKPGDYIDVKVEASMKKGKQKLNIALSWKDDLLSEEAKLKISSKIPDAKLVKPDEVGASKEPEKKDVTSAKEKCDTPHKKDDSESGQAKPAENKAEKEDPKKTKGKSGTAGKK
ncbi:MAG: amphi-Trp domain-containing protein [Desulfobulbaceae bacterium]|nr:amphi-Trp domain-containing protein [Desulfobulbaceae bacterium]